MSKQRIKTILNIGIWATFLGFLFLQYHKVFLYYDDYGYMSMTYGWPPQSGISNKLFYSLSYLYHSYFDVNGRIFTNLLLIVSANLGGLTFMRIVMPICIASIYYLIYKWIVPENDKREAWMVSLFLLLSYGLFPVSVVNCGFYWFAAAYGYVIPTMLFLWLVSIYRNEKYAKLRYLLVFVLCISSEQAIVMTVTWILSNMIYHYVKKHPINRADVFLLAESFLSSAILIGSPASRSRLTGSADYQIGLIERTLDYMKRTIMQMDSLGKVIQCIILFTLLISCVTLFQKTKNKLALPGIIYALFSCAVHLLWAKNLVPATFFAVIWGGLYLLFLVYGFWYCALSDHRISLILLSMYSAVGIMFLMPEAPMRVYIPFLFLLTLICGYVYVHILEIPLKLLTACLLVMLGFISISNIGQTYKEYSKNAKILTINHSKLIEAADKIQAGIDVDSVNLYKMNNDEYCAQQPYFEGVAYMLFWYDNYYNLPYKTTYIFGNYPTGEGKISINILDN